MFFVSFFLFFRFTRFQILICETQSIWHKLLLLSLLYDFCLVADTDDLWKFMSKSSGIDVGSLMNSWIRKMGFPVVVVTVLNTPDIDISGKVTLKLTQHRFCGGNTQSPHKQPMLWSIPIQGDK